MLIPGMLHLQTAAHTPEKRRIYGYTVIKSTGAPVAKRVIVYNRGSDGIALSYLGSTVSMASTGFWEIKGLPVTHDDTVVVTAFDDTKAFNAEVYDFQSLEV